MLTKKSNLENISTKLDGRDITKTMITGSMKMHLPRREPLPITGKHWPRNQTKKKSRENQTPKSRKIAMLISKRTIVYPRKDRIMLSQCALLSDSHLNH
jgi:hypothetical protein